MITGRYFNVDVSCNFAHFINSRYLISGTYFLFSNEKSVRNLYLYLNYMHDTLIDTHAATFTNIYVHEVEFSSKSLRTVFEARNGINQFEIII